MDPRLSCFRIKERLSRALDTQIETYPLILQVGSSVVYEEELCADIDVIALCEPESWQARTPKRVISQEKQLDIEFSIMPLSFPALIARESQLNFYLFRERKKLEHSTCLFGESRKHEQLLALLKKLPLPKSEILCFLSRVQNEISTTTERRGGKEIKIFFLLVTLLGYTHFKLGPVKAKWMFDEVSRCGEPDLINYMHALIEPIRVIDLHSTIKNFNKLPTFLEFWEQKGTTVWRDVGLLAKSRPNASALVLLYCMHVFVYSNLQTARSNLVRQVFNEYLHLLRTDDCNVASAGPRIISTVRKALQ